DGNRNVQGITFSNTSAFGYTLQNGLISLTNGAVIQTASGNGNHTDTISSPITIQANNGSATFTAGATSSTSIMDIGGGGAGSIVGVSSTGNTTTLTLNGTNTGANLVSAVIGNSGNGGKIAVTKAGSGNWTLSNANTYTGATIISGGTLALASTGSLASPTIINNSVLDVSAVTNYTVTSGQTLGGNGTVIGNTIIAGTLAPGNNGKGLLAFSNGVTLNSGSTTTIEISGATTRGTDFDGVNFNGSLTVVGGDLTFSFGSTSITSGTTLDIFGGTGGTLTANFTNVIASGTNYNGTLALNGGSTAYEGVFGGQLVSLALATGDLTFTAIPEPSAFAAIIGAIALVFGIRRRRENRL
ncbi:MAG TPA: autotransporter-associated beta strand repeat-containing protein, partial [Roseimicrobium sp.]|nr:autotransporter-associated beta strand repeat-containing protein [Roseimicrobium sp.]